MNPYAWRKPFLHLSQNKRLEALDRLAPMPKWLWEKLQEIPAPMAPWRAINYRPASAKLKDGTIELCVVFFGEKTFHRSWGPFSPRFVTDIARVVDVFRSPHQLPSQFASELYRKGETGMGAMDFVLTMKDGKKFYYTTGNIVDFIDYPKGYGPEDIVAVESRFVREFHHSPVAMEGPGFSWCLYEESREVLKRIKKEKFIIG